MITALAYPSHRAGGRRSASTAFMVFSVIPKLERFLATIGRKLPAITQTLVDITGVIQAYAGYAAVGGLLAMVLFVAAYYWPPGRLWIDREALRVPLLGTLIRLAATTSFASGLAALLRSGITLLEGLRTAERMQSNRFLAGQVAAARDAVMHGGSLAPPLAAPRAFMPMLSRMVAVGESAGTLDDVLDEVAVFYEAQLQSTIRLLSLACRAGDHRDRRRHRRIRLHCIFHGPVCSRRSYAMKAVKMVVYVFLAIAAGTAWGQEPPRDPTQPSPALRELIDAPKVKALELPVIQLKGRVVGKSQPGEAMLMFDKRTYLVRQGERDRQRAADDPRAAAGRRRGPPGNPALRPNADAGLIFGYPA